MGEKANGKYFSETGSGAMVKALVSLITTQAVHSVFAGRTTDIHFNSLPQ
jgi:hypothetical protein